MPKKKKTRKQKMLADVRRQTEPTASHTATIKIETPVRKEQDSTPTHSALRPEKRTVTKVISTSEYTYLGSDLRKTLLLTIAMVGLMLLIKYMTGI